MARSSRQPSASPSRMEGWGVTNVWSPACKTLTLQGWPPGPEIAGVPEMGSGQTPAGPKWISVHWAQHSQGPEGVTLPALSSPMKPIPLTAVLDPRLPQAGLGWGGIRHVSISAICSTRVESISLTILSMHSILD